MKIILSDREYTFLIGYQKTDKVRRLAFNDLAQKIFGISFEEWYQAGYWNEKYIPYTLFDGDRAVANVSVNTMRFIVCGEPKHLIQIGTVMTDVNYRNQGLTRFLMNKVFDDWNNNCDFIYLYANSSVLEMYPKFGFRSVKEYAFFKSVPKSLTNAKVENLDMNQEKVRNKLYDFVKHSTVSGKLTMQENADLVMFYCISDFKKNIYYIPSLDVITIATYAENKLHIIDVFSHKTIELDQIIYSLMQPLTNEVLLGFTPNDTLAYNVTEKKGNETLFVQNGKSSFFDEEKWMFPILSHA